MARRPLYLRLGALSIIGLAAIAGCSSGGGSASAGGGNSAAALASTWKGTMNEWNWDIPGDDPGESAVLPILIKSLETQYPGAKVVNTSMSLSDQNDKLPLAFASGSSAPDVSETNEGLQNQGRLVVDGELLPLEQYDKIYGWFSKVGPLPLQYNSLPANGKSFGSGSVYGVPETGAVVGIFYNKALIESVGGCRRWSPAVPARAGRSRPRHRTRTPARR